MSAEQHTLCADSRPRLLDLFCGAGGASRGYHDAGFEVVGVDVKPQPNYPFRFVQGDVLRNLAMMRGHRFGEWIVDTDNGLRLHLGRFDAIHASPPCQRYSDLAKRNGNADTHPDLVGAVRDLLEATGLPYVIENVEGAPLLDPMRLCGTTLGLGTNGYRLRRHRLFETNWSLDVPGCWCAMDSRPVIDVSGGGPSKAARLDGKGGRTYKGTADDARAAMGIDWMTKAELNEAIPPTYSRIIGGQLLGVVQRAMAVAV